MRTLSPAELLHSLQRQHMMAQLNYVEFFCLLIGYAANIDADIL